MLAEEHLRDIAARGRRPAEVMMRIAKFYLDFYTEWTGKPVGAGLHDPLAVAVAEDPSLVTVQRLNGDIELFGERTRGQFIADRRREAEGRENVSVCVDVDVQRFLDRLTQALVGL